MPRFLRLRATIVLLLVWESSCHKKQAAVPVPTAPQPSQPAPPAPAPAATSSETPSTGTTTHPAQDASPYQVNKVAPQPPPPAKKPARSATAPPPSTSPAPATAPTPAAPPPKLGDVLTPDEQKQYSASIDQSLAHAQTSLKSIGGRQLNKDQQAEVEQIRNFMQQAQETRSRDPSGAKSLAERAEVLARDLAATFH